MKNEGAKELVLESLHYSGADLQAARDHLDRANALIAYELRGRVSFTGSHQRPERDMIYLAHAETQRALKCLGTVLLKAEEPA